MTIHRLTSMGLALILGACTAPDPGMVPGQGFGAPVDPRMALATKTEAPTFTAELAPIPEIVGTRPRGEARFWLSGDGTSLRYELSVQDLGPATSSHLHVVPSAWSSQSVPHYENPPPPEGAHGPAVAFLLKFVPGGVPGEGVIAKGEIAPSDVIGHLKGQPIGVLLGLLEDNQAYVTVHVLQKRASGQTFCCPDGLRGTVRSAGS
jgi:hypothetical protein